MTNESDNNDSGGLYLLANRDFADNNCISTKPITKNICAIFEIGSASCKFYYIPSK